MSVIQSSRTYHQFETCLNSLHRIYRLRWQALSGPYIIIVRPIFMLINSRWLKWQPIPTHVCFQWAPLFGRLGYVQCSASTSGEMALQLIYSLFDPIRPPEYLWIHTSGDYSACVSACALWEGWRIKAEGGKGGGNNTGGFQGHGSARLRASHQPMFIS